MDDDQETTGPRPTRRPQVVRLPLQHRLGRLHPGVAGDGDSAADVRAFDLTFSSEASVVDRFSYDIGRFQEVLGHNVGEVDMDWLASERAPLLKDHDPRQQIGVIEAASIDTVARVGHARVRFSRSAAGEQERQDVLDGIRTAVSVGYIPRRMVEVAREGDVPTYRVTDWKPVEVSLVSVPADESVGLSRGGDEGRLYEVPISYRSKTMPKDDNIQPTETTTVPQQRPRPPAVDPAHLQREAERLAGEQMVARNREMGEILAIGRRWGLAELAEAAIANGQPLAEFRAAVMAEVERRQTAGGARPLTHLDLTPRETQRYSLLRAVRAAVTHDWSHAGFERECSQAISERLQRAPNGFFLPADVFTRDLTAGGVGGAAELVGTDHRADEFIDLLRPRMMVTQLGARVMSGLQGNVDIPRQAAAASFAWIAEHADATASDMTTETVALTPKTGSARTIISRRLLLQSSPSAEALVLDDLRTVVALGIDLAAIAGTGTGNQPRGVLNTSGVSVVAGATNGAAPTWANIVALESGVANANADAGALAYLTNSKVRGKLKTTEKATGTAMFVWADGTDAGFGSLNGYRAGVSNQVPSNLTKGTGTNLSAIIFGNWSDLVIASWGVLDVQVTNNTRADGGTDVRLFQDVDVVLRRPASFSRMVDAITV